MNNSDIHRTQNIFKDMRAIRREACLLLLSASFLGCASPNPEMSPYRTISPSCIALAKEARANCKTLDNGQNVVACGTQVSRESLLACNEICSDDTCQNSGNVDVSIVGTYQQIIRREESPALSEFSRSALPEQEVVLSHQSGSVVKTVGMVPFSDDPQDCSVLGSSTSFSVIGGYGVYESIDDPGATKIILWIANGPLDQSCTHGRAEVTAFTAVIGQGFDTDWYGRRDEYAWLCK